MRKLFILFVAFFAATTLWAYDFKSGDLYYTSSCNYAPNSVGVTNEDDGTMQVSHYHDLSVVTIPTNVFYNTVSYNVVRVDDYAFYDSPSLQTVKILKGITSIGVGAFQECKLLETITLPNTITRIDDEAFLNTAFYNDESNWENGVLYIGDCLIKAQPSLSGSYTIKDGTRVIAAGAFRDCSLLESIIIPESIETIPSCTFKGCTSLTSVSLPDSVKQIQNNAFENCSSLSSISIPESVEYIGSSVFKNTAMFNNPSNWIDDVFYIDDCLVGASTTFSQTSINIPSNIRLICQEAFVKRTSLQTLTIPTNMTHIGLSAFQQCTNLSKLYVNATTPPSIISNDTCGHGASFSSLPTCYIPYGTLSVYQQSEWVNQVDTFIEFGTSITEMHYDFEVDGLYYKVTSATAPYEVEVTYEKYDGTNYSSLTNVTIPSSVTYDNIEYSVTRIGNEAFYYAKTLKSVSLPNTINSIGRRAFWHSELLSSIVFPSKLEWIDKEAFLDCVKLSSITISSTSLKRIGEDAFVGTAYYNNESKWQLNGQLLCISYSGYYYILNAKSTITGSIEFAYTWVIADGAFKNCTSLTSFKASYYNGVYVGAEAFYNCSSLTSVTLRARNVLARAFAKCVSLTSGVQCTTNGGACVSGEAVYEGCTSLTNVTLISNDKVPVGFCRGCTSLTSVSGGYDVEEIGDYAFQDCSSLQSYDLKKKKIIGNYAFQGSSIATFLMDSVTKIGNYAFEGCPLDTIYIGNFLTEIGRYAFDCDTLKHVYINASTPPVLLGGTDEPVFTSMPICHISYDALSAYQTSKWVNQVKRFDAEPLFNQILYTSTDGNVVTPQTYYQNAKALFGANIISNTYADGKGVITFDAPVVSVGKVAFERKKNLKTIDFPSTLTTILDKAFSECDSLESIIFHSGIKKISPECIYSRQSNFSFYINDLENWCNIELSDDLLNKTFDLYVGGELLTDMHAKGIKKIGEYAFSGCRSLKSVVLDDNVTCIGNRAFERCGSIESLIIGNGCTSIGEYAFNRCGSLNSVDFGDNITSIGSRAFEYCSIDTIIVPNKVTTLEEGVFASNGIVKSIIMGNNIDSIKGSALAFAIDSIAIPSGVTYIANNALSSTVKTLFWNVKELTKDYTSSGNSPIYNMRSNISSIVFGNSVEVIPSYLFSNCTNIHEVTIPKNVKTIGNNVFESIPYLNIYFDNEVPCSIGKAVVNDPTQRMCVYDLDAYVAAWPEYEPYLISRDYLHKEVDLSALPTESALLKTITTKYIESVVSLKINGTINSYDIMVIRNRMPSLLELDLSDVRIIANSFEYATGYCSKNDTLTTQAFTGTGTPILKLVLPKSLKHIEVGAIKNNLQELTINNGTMATKAFMSTGLKSVTLSDSVTIVPDEAFRHCTNLSQLHLPQTIDTIGHFAFQACALQTITLPANLSYLGTGAFAGPAGDYNYSGSGGQYTARTAPGISGTASYVKSYGCQGGSLEEVIIPKDSKLKTISARAFEGNRIKNLSILCDSLTYIEELAFTRAAVDTLILPPALKTIEPLAFAHNTSLKYIVIPETYSTIHNNVFVKCTNLKKIQFPSTLTAIDNYAFAGCTNLSEVDIPGLVTSIGDYAFKDCNINTIYTYLFDPFTIGQNTFSAYVNANATLYVPNVDDVEMKYIYDTQWSQILNCQRMDRTFEYKDFYANGDVVISKNDESLNGNPNANLNPGSGLVVEEGENTQNLGNVTLSSTVQDWASLIAGCNTNVDTLVLSLTVAGHKWHFMGFPFPVKIADIQSDYQYAIFEYDGELRAAKDTTGWKAVPKSQEYLEPGHGYIIQFNTPSDCSITIKVNQPNFCDMVDEMNLKVYPSDKTRNKSWNYVSNPYFAYYDINDLNYTGPITFWDVQTGTYQTFRAGDDDYILSPYEAFFLQNTDETGQFNLLFDQTKGMTKKQSQEKQSQRMIAKRNNSAEENLRSVINITLSDGNNSDATRVVINEEASLLYDMGADAAKFMSTERVPQIYSYDSEHGMCAINERPMGNGTIDLGIKLPQAGTYFFACTRMDTTFYLLDREMNITHDFTYGDYYFDAKAGTNSSRFALIRTRQNVSTDVENTTHATLQTNSDGIYVNGNAYLQIYNVAGALLLEGNMSGHVHLMPGVYMVVNNGVTSKHVIK